MGGEDRPLKARRVVGEEDVEILIRLWREGTPKPSLPLPRRYVGEDDVVKMGYRPKLLKPSIQAKYGIR